MNVLLAAHLLLALGCLSAMAFVPVQVPTAHQPIQSDLHDLDDAFDAARRVIVPTSAGFQLQNPASQLNIDLDGRGSSLGAAPGGPIFELELKCLDYAVALFSPPERVTRQTARNRVTYAWGADLEE